MISCRINIYGEKIENKTARLGGCYSKEYNSEEFGSAGLLAHCWSITASALVPYTIGVLASTCVPQAGKCILYNVDSIFLCWQIELGPVCSGYIANP